MADAKFELFWNAVKDGPYDLPDDIKSHLKTAIQAAGFNTVSTGTVTVIKAKKKVNGYNLFMKDKTAELKANNTPPDQRMKAVAELWKLLTDDDKKVWKAKADAMPAPDANVKTVTTPSAPRSLTGYQLYVRETMPQVKSDTTVVAKERMAKIGSLWKALDKSSQEAFSVKAKGMLAGSPAKATA
jgi:hypothetical protein